MKVNVYGRGVIPGVGLLPVYNIEMNDQQILRTLNFRDVRVFNAATGIIITRQGLLEKMAEPKKLVPVVAKPVVKETPVVQPEPVKVEPVVVEAPVVEPVVEEVPVVEETPVVVEEPVETPVVEETVVDETAEVLDAVVDELNETAEAPVVESETTEKPFTYHSKKNRNRNKKNNN